MFFNGNIQEELGRSEPGEPGNMNLHRCMIFVLVLCKRGVTDQELGPAGQRQLIGSRSRTDIPGPVQND